MLDRVGLFSLGCYKAYTRIVDKCFSVLVSGAFAKFGRRSVLALPVRLSGEARIEIGERVFIGANSWLQTLPDGDNRSSAITIGNGTSIAGACVISAVRRVVLEDDVLLARNVYISDHVHRYVRTDLPVLAQGIEKIAPVVIRRGAWLGQNVVVCPGVRIGIGSVVGANSVVNEDIPDYSVAVGAPARVVKSIPLEPPSASSLAGMASGLSGASHA
jgi:acetyltransferase-like isoleucine patch superfamily enzyme